MARRKFLKQVSALVTSGMFTGCGSAAAPLRRSGPRVPIQAICFDLFTLFDPRSVVAAAQEVVGDASQELCDAWRTRQFEYTWLRTSAGQHVDFKHITEHALLYAARARKLTLGDRERTRLVDAYSRLSPWPDTREVLASFQARGIRLAPLANYAPEMLRELVAHNGFEPFFSELLSTEVSGTFKPNPRAYALGEQAFSLPREAIAFSAFGGWDAAGARWFGYPTFWVNRLAVAPEELPPGPDGTGPTLRELEQFVSGWA